MMAISVEMLWKNHSYIRLCTKEGKEEKYMTNLQRPIRDLDF
jgi:hypothetical protein